MISNIVDSNGLLVFRGNDVDAKFATILSTSGYVRVDGDTGNFEHPKWDGLKWVEGKTSMQQWQEDMSKSDVSMMPRWMEVHIEHEHNGVVADATLQQKYNDKKALRAGRPE